MPVPVNLIPISEIIGNPKKQPPIMQMDPMERLLQQIQRFDPAYHLQGLLTSTDYPRASEFELVQHYLFGSAGPFIDLLVYVDLGVGWTYRPVGFDSEEEGTKAVDLAEEFDKKVKLHKSMNRFGTLYETIGRACIVKTFDGNGEFYSSPDLSVTGIDVINPMTLTVESIYEVMVDTQGQVPFMQIGLMGEVAEFTQDRVIYETQNNLNGVRSIVGISKLQRCVNDLRTLARMPLYRNKLARLYSQLMTHIKIDTTQMEGELKDALMEDVGAQQKYLDDAADYYTEMNNKGATAATYQWMELTQSSFAGKEVKLAELEQQTMAAIAFKIGVPLSLLDMSSANVLNRATLQSLVETFVARQEKGTRKHIYKPIIEDLINEFLETQGITGGKLECVFNPFLPANLEVAAQIISQVAPTGAITNPEIRNMIQLPQHPDLGGDDWEDQDDPLNPIPNANINNLGATDTPLPDPNDAGIVEAAVPQDYPSTSMQKAVDKVYNDLIGHGIIKVVKDDEN